MRPHGNRAYVPMACILYYNSAHSARRLPSLRKTNKHKDAQQTQTTFGKPVQEKVKMSHITLAQFWLKDQ